MASGIYKILNTIDERIYVGSSKNMEKRFNVHKCELNTKKHKNPHLLNFINKYGIDKLSFEVLEYCEKDKLEEKENYYFTLLSPQFNICKKAYRLPEKRNFTEEQIKEYAELYNNGRSLRWIAINILGNEKYRYTFNDIKNGKTYQEYSHYFIKRKYDQTGKITSEKTKAKLRETSKFALKIKENHLLDIIKRINNRESMRVIADSYKVHESLISLIKTGKLHQDYYHLITHKSGKHNSLTMEEKNYIRDNYKKISVNNMAKEINRDKTIIYKYINKNLK